MAERVLIIDDDRKLAGMLVEYLRPRGIDADVAGDAVRGLSELGRRPYDAVVLDIMLPDLDGFEVCRRLRAGSDVPVLMLTARGDPEDRVVGLELGADDYLPKPFDPRELLARLRAIMRRRRSASAAAPAVLRFGRLEIDPAARQVRLDGQVRPLTGYQFDILHLLARHAGRVLSRDVILERLRSDPGDSFDRSIDVHVSRIRAAIEEDPRHPSRLVTVRGAGYQFARLPEDDREDSRESKVESRKLPPPTRERLEGRQRVSPGANQKDAARAAAQGRFQHRMYHRIFVSMLGFVVLALLLTALAGHLLLSEVFRTGVAGHLSGRAMSMAGELPPATAPAAEQQVVLERLANERRVAAAIWSADGRRLAFTTADLPSPTPGVTTSYWLPSRTGPVLAIPLPDGRTLVMQPHHIPRPLGFVLSVFALAAVLALASLPVARRITRRLETLEAGVRRLGEGDLASRVNVEGDDELASLGRSFNHTAARLQRLVEAQRRVLASASHELRSPLARLRMALELSRDDPAAARPRLDQAVVEVAELDSLVEELLLAGRIEVQEGIPAAEPVDLEALVSEEAARAGATVEIRPVTIVGDPRLLRVLLRNLLENARRHAGGAVEVVAEPLQEQAGTARILVSDRGPGVPETERESIFEPFYRPTGHAEGRDGGVGLGLYLVRRIAERHGGTATCRSRDGGGTVFEVILRPTVEQPLKPATATDRPVES